MKSAGGGRLAVPGWLRPTVPDWLSEVVPDWLTEVMRPRKVPPPWGAMARAVFAIWVPLAAGFITGQAEIVMLPAMGGLMCVMIDNAGTFRSRVRRVGNAAIFGGAMGLLIGSLIHGRGWIAVVVLVLVAGVSSVLTRLGAVWSLTGLQLMVYCAVSLGPLGLLRPWWHTALEFVAGVAWALLLIVPGWLLSPRGVEQRLIADVYHAFADDMRAIGTPDAVDARHNLAAALNAAYDALLTGRSVSSGRSRRTMHLMAILTVSHQMAEASGALRHEEERPPPWVTDTIDRLADAVMERRVASLPTIPPHWSVSPGGLALRESMVSLARVIAGHWTPPSAPSAADRPGFADRVRAGAGNLLEQLVGGWVAWTFTIRLMLCTGIAAVVSEVAPLTRSYWVVLSVAVILKPDFGSVFARALQRGLGTVLGAVLGAVILAVVPYGPWLLLPFGVLAALLPYGKAKNFGLSAVFLTPFVVLLIDLLDNTGWQLAGDRAIDTVIGMVIVLLFGYAFWPVSWQANLPGQFAGTLRVIGSYLTASLGQDSPLAHGGSARPPAPSRLRRQAFRSLSDLRAEFQRSMSEPEPASRHATAWWPAVVGLEELLDAITRDRLAIARGAAVPDARAVHKLAGALTAVADSMEAGLPPVAGKLPDDPALAIVTDAASAVLSALNPLPADEEDREAGEVAGAATS
ncbi:MAG: FUSC family protein [Nocardiopsaceae bacterium]|nr:FUSC family protein [Nocardiopsaceae bacterium]